MNNKKLIITLSIIASLVLTLGITFAVFTYNKVSINNSKLIVGDIYMHYTETNQIQMENAMPINPYVVNPIMKTQEYTEGGTNELSKCVDGLVSAGAPTNEASSWCKGGKSGGLTMQQAYEYGFLDEMNLTNTFIEANVLTINSNIPYFEFTIDGKNTTTNKDIWYEIVLSKGDNLEGKTRIKDNLLKFRLVEIKDNKETIVLDDKTYQDLTSKRVWVNTINKNTTKEIKITYRLYMWISNDTKIGNIDQDYTMEEWKNVFASIKVGVNGDFDEKDLSTDASCFITTVNSDNTVTISGYDLTCGTNVIIPSVINNMKVTAIANCDGWEPMSNKLTLSPNNLNNYTNKKYILKNTGNQYVCAFKTAGLKNVIIPNSVTTIGAGAFSANQLTSIEIPNSVTTIEGGVFLNNQLTSIEIPDSVTVIGEYAFSNNRLTSVEIPDNVTIIDGYAFEGNRLTSVTIGSGIKYIERRAFCKHSSSNPNLESITINKSCTDIKNIPGSSFDTTEYYPWLSIYSPYTASGVTIYGLNEEVCDSY